MLGFIFGGLVKNLERAAGNVSRDFVKSAGQEVGYLFDEKLYPLADRLDYMAQERIEQSKGDIEELESKIKADIESLIDNAHGRTRQALEEVNRVREAALKDLKETIGQSDGYLENRINQVSLVVMEALKYAQSISSEFAPKELKERLFEPTLAEINNIEDKLFEDANQIVDRIDEAINGKLELIRNELKKYFAHALPNPFDKCRRRLKIGLKPGVRLSDIELYELSECYELSKLDETTPIDEVLKIYGQLQQNAAMMAALVKKAPELKRRAIQDWLKYGVLCEFWHDTIKSYGSTPSRVLEPQKQRLLTTKGDAKKLLKTLRRGG